MRPFFLQKSGILVHDEPKPHLSDDTLLYANDTNTLLYIVTEDVSNSSLQPTFLPNVR